jgi:hypothetical protein
MEKISLDFVKEVAEKLRESWKKGKRAGDEDLAKLNSYVKSKQPGDLKDFANSAIMYFKTGKLKWDDFGMFQGEYAPGFNVIPWTYLTRSLTGISPQIEKEMPKAFQDKLEEGSKVAASFLKTVGQKYIIAGDKYPQHKQAEHKGDSYIIYEAGSRDPEDPFGTRSFKKLVKETEGKDAEANRNFEVNHQDLKRDSGNFPDERDMNEPFGLEADKRIAERGTPREEQETSDPNPPQGYPSEKDWWQQALSQYDVKGTSMKFLPRVKVVGRDTKQENIDKEIESLLKDAEKAEFTKSHAHMPLEKRIELIEMKKKDALKKKAQIERTLAGNKELAYRVRATDLRRLEAVIRHYNHGIDMMKQAIGWRDHDTMTTQDINIDPKGAKLVNDDIKSYALPAGHTCPRKGKCREHCFALSGRTENQPCCQENYAKSLGIAERDDFVKKMNEKLSKIKPVTPPWKKPFRIHPWGDFYSNKYAEKWLQIIKDNPQIWFYAYSKSHRMPAVQEMAKQPNFKLIQSYDGTDDKKIDPNMTVCRVFKNDAELSDYNAKHPNDPYIECKHSDLVTADPANKRLAVVKHGNTYAPSGFDLQTVMSAVGDKDDDGHFAHEFDQIDAPHHWSDEEHHEYAQYMGWHQCEGNPCPYKTGKFKNTVMARYSIS